MLQSKNGLENKKIKKLGDEIELEEIVQDVFIQKKEGAVFQKKIEVPLRPHAIKYLWFVFLFYLFLYW